MLKNDKEKKNKQQRSLTSEREERVYVPARDADIYRRPSPKRLIKEKSTLDGILEYKSPVNLAKVKVGGFDYVFLVLVAFLVAFGTVMVFSSSYAFADTRYDDAYHFIRSQILGVTVGVVFMLFFSLLNYRVYFHGAPIVYLVTVGFLLVVLALGFTAYGAQRWVQIGPFSFQPSELAKTTVVLMLAWFMVRYKDKIIDYKNIKGNLLYSIGIPLCIIGVLAVLIVLEKHLSGTVIIVAIGFLMMDYLGTPRRITIPFVLICGVLAFFVILYASDHGSARIESWLDPEAHASGSAWQYLQGKYAIGSGGIFGLGLGASRMKHSYVSQPQNDFIFAIICEELGFIGAIVVIVAFAFLIMRGFRIAAKAPDTFASAVAYGITVHIALQVILNIMVVTGLIPNTGISLPFFSSGNSAMIMTLSEMGIMLSISRASYIER